MSTTGHALLRTLPGPVGSSPLDQPASPRLSGPEPLRAAQVSNLDGERERAKETEVPKSTPKHSTSDTKAVDKPVEPPSGQPSEQPSKQKTKEPELEESQEDEDDKPSDLELINMETFGQILELDEDEDSHDFSQPMVWDYFEQAEKTFEDMDKAHAQKDLLKLSHLGHFLKGSSAALGLARVQKSCEKIQHYGQLRDEVADKDLKPAEALELTSKLLRRVKKEYFEAQKWLKDFYGSDLDGDA